MLLNVCTIITVLIFASRPAIMPLADQNQVAPINTKDRTHSFVTMLEKKFAAYENKLEEVQLKEFVFISCDTFQDNVRLNYYRDTDKKDKEGNPLKEFLLIMFRQKGKRWTVIKAKHVFVKSTENSDPSEQLKQILKEDKEFSLPLEKKEDPQ